MRIETDWTLGAIEKLVLLEDNHLLAMEKPAGMLTQGDRTGDISLMDLAKRYLKEKYKKPGEVYLGLVHRLDRPVGGVIVFARTSKAAARLSEQFRTRAVRKVYWAVVEGRPDPLEGELSHTLAKSGTMMKAVPAGTAGAQEAQLRYRMLETNGQRSLVEVELITGRKHQIRAQLSAMGWPIVGDIKYRAMRRQRTHAGDRPVVAGIALVAKSLTFSHPVTGAPITVETGTAGTFSLTD